MKFNITADDAIFYVNEKNRTVTCVIEKTQFLLIEFINSEIRLFPGINIFNSYNDKLYEKIIMPNKFVGVATCSENDEWNVEIGKLIAFSRAKDNLLKSFFKRANTYIHYINNALDEAIDIFNKLGEKLTENCAHRHAYINELLGPEEDVEQNSNL